MAIAGQNATSFSYNIAGAVGNNVNSLKATSVLDVTGMEWNFALSDTHAAASASITTVTAVDGGATGELVATTAALFTTLTNGPSTGTAWTAMTPRAATMLTTATDIDADDTINLVLTSAGTAASSLSVMCSYIYGKPMSIA